MQIWKKKAVSPGIKQRRVEERRVFKEDYSHLVQNVKKCQVNAPER